MQAIIYAAKSTKDPKGSIPRQLDKCRDKAADEGWPIAAEYTDEDFSAYSGNRGPGLERALAHVREIGQTDGEAILLVWRANRISRGAGDKPDAPRALVEIWHELRRHNVDMVAQAGEDLGTSKAAADVGEREMIDSRKKGEDVGDGQEGCVVERGQWRGGILPGGYEAHRSFGEKGEVLRKIVKHPEDELHYDMIWRLAEQGASMQRISLELGRAGAMTRPVRAKSTRKGREVEYTPRPFTTNRVQQVLNNPFYAGQQTWRGKTYEGDWPTYVDIGTFERLKADRDKRSGGGTKRERGRPREGYLLSELARCASCGATMQGVKDASRVRHYICHNRREYGPSHEHHCSAPILDAAAIDQAVVGGIERLLGDAATLLEQLESGERAERDRLKREATAAAEDAVSAESAAERATAEFADAEDDDERALLKDAAKQKRQQAASARTRADAALDALDDERTPDPDAAAAVLWERLSVKIEEAGADVKVLNAALRESFESFELRANGDGGFVVVPMLAAEATARVLLEEGLPSDAALPSLLDGGLALPAFVV
jgi:hypothetical protein